LLRHESDALFDFGHQEVTHDHQRDEKDNADEQELVWIPQFVQQAYAGLEDEMHSRFLLMNS
jgi:hypothetical protein